MLSTSALIWGVGVTPNAQWDHTFLDLKLRPTQAMHSPQPIEDPFSYIKNTIISNVNILPIILPVAVEFHDLHKIIS